MRRLRILTWHVHGSYLYYLSSIPHDIFLPVKPNRDPGYNGRTKSYPWPSNVHEIPVEEVRNQRFDCILFQSRTHYLEDQYVLLSPEQRRLPRIYVEHDPPREHPTDTRHCVNDPEILLVHVTAFNSLMWDNRRTPTRVIDHGVPVPEGNPYEGTLPRGLVVVNNMALRGRRLGLDIFQRLRDRVPLDLIGMGWKEVGGLGEIPYFELNNFMARYRFFFNPIRYTSLGLAICEAMMNGLPIIGLATTELVTVIQNGRSGFLATDPEKLVEPMQALLADPGLARNWGQEARRTAMERFTHDRFVRDWCDALAQVTDTRRPDTMETREAA